MTPAVGRLIEGVDRERVAIGRKLGVDVVPDPELGVLQGYMTEATYDNGFITSPGFAGVKAQPSLDYRYFNEDVGYGLVFLQKLGEQVGVATPMMSAVILVLSLRSVRAVAVGNQMTQIEQLRFIENTGIRYKFRQNFLAKPHQLLYWKN